MPITEATRKRIFSILKKHLETCTPPMVGSSGKEKLTLHIRGNKAVPYGYDKKIIPGMFFAAIEQRKDSVAFHFFPSYFSADMKKVAPSLYACLKGKTCFHFKKAEQVNEKELKALLKAGVKLWKKEGYVE
jgi:hypothetical protein